MKRYIKSSDLDTVQLNFNIEVVLGYTDTSNQLDVAATKQIPPNLPKGPLPSGDKNAIIGIQTLADYNAFIQEIEDLITNYYDLKICYANISNDHSHYYTMLAKDDSGQLVLDFKLRMRIATHPAHDTPEMRHNKKIEEQFMQQFEGKKRLKVLYIEAVLNDTNDQFNNYDEAYVWIDEKIESKVQVMKRRLKYGKD